MPIGTLRMTARVSRSRMRIRPSEPRRQRQREVVQRTRRNERGEGEAGDPPPGTVNPVRLGRALHVGPRAWAGPGGPVKKAALSPRA